MTGARLIRIARSSHPMRPNLSIQHWRKRRKQNAPPCSSRCAKNHRAAQPRRNRLQRNSHLPGSPLTAMAPQTPNDQTRQPIGTIARSSPARSFPASLVTEINSESPGPVIAQVTQSIYDSATGRTLLIPQGARLIGDYKSSTRYGQSRVAIVWSRLIMPDGDEIALDEAAADPSGAAGVTGEVDNHWRDVFGAAALGTLINIGVATTEDPQLTYGGIGVITRDPVDDAIAEGVQRTASVVTNRVVDRSLAIPPTIRVEAGKRISVIVTRQMKVRLLGLDRTFPRSPAIGRLQRAANPCVAPRGSLSPIMLRRVRIKQDVGRGLGVCGLWSAILALS